ncbi:MAG: exodeoxyribonuclease V subunit gamma [Pseudonocardia sp.]
MLHVHRAERADALADALAEVLLHPLDDPFTAEVVAVPAKGVERWLVQRLSHRLGAATGRGDGVCAHVDFPSPAAVVSEVVCAAAGIVVTDDPWLPARAVWPLLEVIDFSAGEAWCAALSAHLGLDESAGRRGEHVDTTRSAGGAGVDTVRRGRRYTAARHLAELFGAYATHRPRMVQAWQAGDDEGVPHDLRWQPELWRRLRKRIDVPDPAERLLTACGALAIDPGLTALPKRLSLFGPTRLPAEHLAVLGALAAHREVHLWLAHPSPQLWERVRPGGIPLRRADPTTDAARHPLLSSLGRDVRELQLRLAAAIPTPTDHHHALPERPTTLLGRLQRDLRDDRAPGAGGQHLLAGQDRSIQVHACHGAHRQVEVLREVVLGLLAADDTLEPRDILVMCPDVEAFAPLISAAFGLGRAAGDGAAHPGHQLQVRLADRALRQVNPLLDTVAQLLELADARLTASQVLDLVAAAPVRRRFGIDDDDLQRLRGLVGGARVRWGLDGAHRRPYGLERFGQNTWSAGLDRMLLGVAMSEDDGHWLGTALPLDDVDSSDVERVGRLAELVDRLGAVLGELVGERSLAEWVAVLVGALDALTATAPADTWQATQARAELTDVVRAAGPHATSVPLALADVRGLLAGCLRGRPTRANFRTGSLTVATLVPMRSVPHRVVCLLGMDDDVFPRAGVPDGDDILARHPLVGERDPRSEDRQLFLDAICAATEHLVVVYSGADERTGARRPPAVPLGELLDTLDASVRTADGSPARQHVVTRHPLQPFDARNFTPGTLATTGPFSFDRTELAGAVAAAAPKRPPAPFLGIALPPPPDRAVELADLRAFVRHPVRAFLRQRVGVSLVTGEEDAADSLPVELDGLGSWSIGEQLLRDRLAGHDLERCRQAGWRRGELPPGALGRRVLQAVVEDVEPLVVASAGIRVGQAVVVDVDVTLPDGHQLIGTVGGLHQETLVRVEYSRLAPKHRLRAWVELLALAAAHPGREWRAVTIGRGTHSGLLRCTLGPVGPERATALLAELVTLHRRGMCEPLPLATATSHTYAHGRSSGSAVADALASAAKRWAQDRAGRDDAAHQLVWGAGAPLSALLAAPPGPGESASNDEPTRFGALALGLWTPIFATETLDHP